MKDKAFFILVIIGMVLTGCGSTPSASGGASAGGTGASRTLAALLRTARSEIQRWDASDGTKYDVTVYSFDFAKKDELFQAVKDAAYNQVWSGEFIRDWELQRGILRWCVPSNPEK